MNAKTKRLYNKNTYQLIKIKIVFQSLLSPFEDVFCLLVVTIALGFCDYARSCGCIYPFEHLLLFLLKCVYFWSCLD